RGTAAGHASFMTGDLGSAAKSADALVGIPDTVAPALDVPKGLIDTLAPLLFAASEPLPETVTARLLPASGGPPIPLEPVVVAGSVVGGPSMISGFRKPDVALAYSQSYLIDMSDLVDLAGNAGPPVADALSFVTDPPPPL